MDRRSFLRCRRSLIRLETEAAAVAPTRPDRRCPLTAAAQGVEPYKLVFCALQRALYPTVLSTRPSASLRHSTCVVLDRLRRAGPASRRPLEPSPSTPPPFRRAAPPLPTPRHVGRGKHARYGPVGVDAGVARFRWSALCASPSVGRAALVRLAFVCGRGAVQPAQRHSLATIAHTAADDADP